MDLGLAGKVALVTASSRGLGRASAQALSQEGAKVVLCARDEAALAEAAAAMPGEALAVAADVTDPTTPQRLADAAVEVELDPGELEELAALAEPPERYWRERAGLSWS